MQRLVPWLADRWRVAWRWVGAIAARIRAAGARVRRAPGWMVGLIWLTAGLALGLWAVRSVLALPVFGHVPAGAPVSTVGTASAADAASVAGPIMGVWPGEVRLTWRVTNTGGRAWQADAYRFVPGARDLPVIPLPRSVPVRETVTVWVRLPLPEQAARQEVGWHLTGPRGEVAGGELRAVIDLAGNWRTPRRKSSAEVLVRDLLLSAP